jgi:glycosyltransferase involved in cell wall biosynthesis
LKILFLGHYREGNSGWSRAAQELITAFDSVGADIVCRPVVLNGNGTPSDIVRKCEAKSIKDCDVVIQCLLPHHMVYSGHFRKNIAIPFVETYMQKDNDWVACLNNMDEVWSSSPWYLDNLTTKVKELVIPTDVDRYARTYPKLDIPQLYNDYVFYYIGDVNKRKNIQALIRAYYMTFTKHDPVSLVLKINKHGFSPDQLHEIMVNEIRQITDAMRIYPTFEDYKQIILLTEEITDAQIMGLHNRCNVYVSTSCGEGLNLPLVDAYGVGNPVITTNLPCGEFRDITSINSLIQPAYNLKDNFPFQFTSRDSWLEPSIQEISYAMRDCYNKKLGKDITRNLNFMSYQECGENMMGELYVSN